MARWRTEHPDVERLQQRTVRVLVAAQVVGGAAIGVGAAVSPLLAKEILGGDDTFAGVAFAALTFGSELAAVPLSRLMSRRWRRPGLVRGYVTAMTGAAAVVAAEIESFSLLLAGMVLMGSADCAHHSDWVERHASSAGLLRPRHNRWRASRHSPSFRLGRGRHGLGRPQGRGPSEDRADRTRYSDGTDPSRRQASRRQGHHGVGSEGASVRGSGNIGWTG